MSVKISFTYYFSNNPFMKISIITATYNSGATARDTIESVLSQNYSDFEHIIVDGGSKDNTLDIIKEYEPKYNGRLKWISEPDKGIYDAMNKGIMMTTGDVIGILNSDDFYASNNSLNLIAKNIEGKDIVFGDLIFVNQTDTNRIVRSWKGSPFKEGSFFKGWHPAHPTFYARKECFEKSGSFDIGYQVSADFELMLRFLEKEKYSSNYIPENLVKMRIGGESTNSIKNIIKGNKFVLKAFKKNGFKVPKLYIIRRLGPKGVQMIKRKLHLI